MVPFLPWRSDMHPRFDAQCRDTRSVQGELEKGLKHAYLLHGETKLNANVQSSMHANAFTFIFPPPLLLFDLCASSRGFFSV